MSKQRKFRVSVFAPDITDLGSSPLRHHACKSQRNAEEQFLKYVVQKEKPRVIVHQGNLRGHAYKTHLDSYWGEHFSDPAKQWRDFVENERVKRGQA